MAGLRWANHGRYGGHPEGNSASTAEFSRGENVELSVVRSSLQACLRSDDLKLLQQ